MTFHSHISNPAAALFAAAILGLCATAANAQGEAADQATQTPVAAPPPDPQPQRVTCTWDGARTIDGPGCTPTNLRQVLTCSDGTEQVGPCVS